jgi:hypothetical protein
MLPFLLSTKRNTPSREQIAAEQAANSTVRSTSRRTMMQMMLTMKSSQNPPVRSYGAA